MPEYDNTENTTEHLSLDTEDWQLAFEPYKGFPGQALTLGFNLTVLKSYIAFEPPMIQETVDALDWAMEVLFQHSQFHEVAYRLFHKLVEGQLSNEEEETLKSLGLKF